MTPRRHGVSTIAVHGPAVRRPDWAPAVLPIVQSATFTNPVGSEEEILYTGSGNNPTQLALAKKYALLEGTEDAIFLASGSGATALPQPQALLESARYYLGRAHYRERAFEPAIRLLSSVPAGSR